MKKAIIIAVVCCVVILAEIGGVIGTYNYIRYNTLDSIAVEYIYENQGSFTDYGKIEQVGRNIIEPSGQTKSTAFRHYTVETATYDVVVVVNFEYDEVEWMATSLEVKFVREDDN